MRAMQVQTIFNCSMTEASLSPCDETQDGCNLSTLLGIRTEQGRRSLSTPVGLAFVLVDTALQICLKVQSGAEWVFRILIFLSKASTETVRLDLGS